MKTMTFAEVADAVWRGFAVGRKVGKLGRLLENQGKRLFDPRSWYLRGAHDGLGWAILREISKQYHDAAMTSTEAERLHAAATVLGEIRDSVDEAIASVAEAAMARGVVRMVRCKQLVATLSDAGDRKDRPAGWEGRGSTNNYRLETQQAVLSDDRVLDWFHTHVPIGAPDEFEVSVVWMDADGREIAGVVENHARIEPDEEWREDVPNSGSSLLLRDIPCMGCGSPITSSHQAYRRWRVGTAYYYFHVGCKPARSRAEESADA